MRFVELDYAGKHMRFSPDTLSLWDNGSELPVSSAVPAKPDTPRVGVNFVTLNVAHDCNMACPYCFAKEGLYGGARQLMTQEVANKCVDWLIRTSGSQTDLYLRFLGGEPFLNVPVIRETMAYGLRIAAEAGKSLHFSVNTNGTLFDQEISELMEEYKVTISVSMDGTREAHDRFRVFKGGQGTFDAVVRNLPAILRTDPLAMVNATLTGETLRVSEYAACFRELGFRLLRFVMVGTSDPTVAIRQEEALGILREEYDRVGQTFMKDLMQGDVWYLADLYKYVPNLRQRVKRASRCGAGTTYVNIDVEGEVHLCHRFTADRTQVVSSIRESSMSVDASIASGSVANQTAPSVSADTLTDAPPEFVHRQLDGTPFFTQGASLASDEGPCVTCDIKAICGGYCYHDGQILYGNLHGGPDGFKCEVDRHLARIAMRLLVEFGTDHSCFAELERLHRSSIQHTE